VSTGEFSQFLKSRPFILSETGDDKLLEGFLLEHGLFFFGDADVLVAAFHDFDR
jgi:hypothetical protein